MSDPPLPGPLDEFLNNPPAGPEPSGLRRELLLKTSSLVRRRRLVRRLAAAASVAAAIVLTALTVWLALYRHGGPEDKELPVVIQRKDGPIPPPVKDGDHPVPPEDEKRPANQSDQPPTAMPPAVALEWKAFDAPAAQKATLYLRAGDRYVEDGRDLASAVRCYGQAVQVATAEALEIDPDDNWLVMALKLDQIERRKEK
jgi:hypothetical protein